VLAERRTRVVGIDQNILKGLEIVWKRDLSSDFPESNDLHCYVSPIAKRGGLHPHRGSVTRSHRTANNGCSSIGRMQEDCGQ